MEVSFRAQPFAAFGGWTANWLEEALGDPDIDHLRVAVAWAKRSGLSRIRDVLTKFREGGGNASMVLGVDEGGATVQGLRLSVELFNAVHVFHERSRRTFHPKVYLAFGSSSAHLLVGSNNVTAGGLFSNYEGSLLCRLDLHREEDRRLFDVVNSWFGTMLSDTAVCKPLSDELLATLIRDRRYGVRDEDQARRDRGEEEDYDGVATDPADDEIFGSGSSPKAGMPPPVQVSPPVAPAAPQMPTVAIPTTVPQATPPAVSVTHHWAKEMSASDAQHPHSTTSNVIGALKLTKAGHNIDHKTYFRNTFFGGVVWATQTTSRGPKEEAIVTFDVVIAGRQMGQIPLKIDHAAYRVARQGNVATWLHWGPLGATLRQTDYTGAWVIIERLTDGGYHLEITPAAPSHATGVATGTSGGN